MVTGGMKTIQCEATGRRLLEACPLFRLNFAPCACLHLLLFLLYEPFTAINLSHAYEYMLSAVNPSSESLDLGVVLGTLPSSVSSPCSNQEVIRPEPEQ